MARDREIEHPFSKDLQITAIRGARNYLGDKLIRVAPPHRLLDPDAGPLIAVRLNILTRKTLGGLETDLSGRVLRPGGEVFPGPVRRRRGRGLRRRRHARLPVAGGHVPRRLPLLGAGGRPRRRRAVSGRREHRREGGAERPAERTGLRVSRPGRIRRPPPSRGPLRRTAADGAAVSGPYAPYGPYGYAAPPYGYGQPYGQPYAAWPPGPPSPWAARGPQRPGQALAAPSSPSSRPGSSWSPRCTSGSSPPSPTSRSARSRRRRVHDGPGSGDGGRAAGPRPAALRGPLVAAGVLALNRRTRGARLLLLVPRTPCSWCSPPTGRCGCPRCSATSPVRAGGARPDVTLFFAAAPALALGLLLTGPGTALVRRDAQT